MSIRGIGQNYYQGNMIEAKSRCRKNYSLSGFDPNKRYQTNDEFVNDLFAMEKNLKVQYKEMAAESKVSTVEDLKMEIGELFPEYTIVPGKPEGVTEGKNLLYIDDTNLQKMLNDSSYKAEIYALMKRELTGTDGFHLCGSAWKLTGTVFTLSEDNPNVGGIRYKGICTSVRLDDSCTFSAKRDKTNILSIMEKSEVTIKEKKTEKFGTDKERVKKLWEKEIIKHREVQEKIQQEIIESQEESKQFNREMAAKKYEEQLRVEY